MAASKRHADSRVPAGRPSCVMGWASGYIERLQRGETVSFRVRSGRLNGWVSSRAIFGRLVRVEG